MHRNHSSNSSPVHKRSIQSYLTKTKSISLKEQTGLSTRAKERLAADDAEIAALEKKLRINSRTSTKSDEYGLGDILSVGEDSDGTEAALSLKRKRGEYDTWLEDKRRKISTHNEGGSRPGTSSRDQEPVGSLHSSNDDDSLALEDVEEFESSDDGHDSTTGDGAGLDEYGSETMQLSSTQIRRERENPYVAPRTDDTQPARKYVPPSLRIAPQDDAEMVSRLGRQIQGLLNRLSESNLVSILAEVEKIFQTNPRHYVVSNLIDRLLNLICDRTTLSDTFIVLHAGFIAAVYKTIGTDFGAQMIERTVNRFDQYYDAAREDIENRKEVVNLVSLLSQLYNLQVIASDLIFDLIRTFLVTLTEAHTELLLRVVRCKCLHHRVITIRNLY